MRVYDMIQNVIMRKAIPMNFKKFLLASSLAICTALSAQCSEQSEEAFPLMGLPRDVRTYFYEHHAPLRLLSLASKSLQQDILEGALQSKGLRIKVDSILLTSKGKWDGIATIHHMPINDFVKLLSKPLTFISGIALYFSANIETISEESLELLLCSDHIKRVNLYAGAVEPLPAQEMDRALTTILKKAQGKGRLCSFTYHGHPVSNDLLMAITGNDKLTYLYIDECVEGSKEYLKGFLEPIIALRRNPSRMNPNDIFQMIQCTQCQINIIKLRFCDLNRSDLAASEPRTFFETDFFIAHLLKFEKQLNNLRLVLDKTFDEKNHQLALLNNSDEAIQRNAYIKQLSCKNLSITLREGMLLSKLAELVHVPSGQFSLLSNGRNIFSGRRYRCTDTDRVDFVHALKNFQNLHLVPHLGRAPICKNYFDSTTVDVEQFAAPEKQLAGGTTH